MDRIKIIQGISLNVVRLNDPIKRKQIRNLIKKNNSDIVCLQETHLRNQDEKYLKEIYKG